MVCRLPAGATRRARPRQFDHTAWCALSAALGPEQGVTSAAAEGHSQALVRGQDQLRVGGEDGGGGGARLEQELGVGGDVAEPQLGQAGLARPEQLARAPQLEVTLGDDEAIVGRRHHRQALTAAGVGAPSVASTGPAWSRSTC